jgi:hypothetical protein
MPQLLIRNKSPFRSLDSLGQVLGSEGRRRLLWLLCFLLLMLLKF